MSSILLAKSRQAQQTNSKSHRRKDVEFNAIEMRCIVNEKVQGCRHSSVQILHIYPQRDSNTGREISVCFIPKIGDLKTNILWRYSDQTIKIAYNY